MLKVCSKMMRANANNDSYIEILSRVANKLNLQLIIQKEVMDSARTIRESLLNWQTKENRVLSKKEVVVFITTAFLEMKGIKKKGDVFTLGSFSEKPYEFILRYHEDGFNGYIALQRQPVNGAELLTVSSSFPELPSLNSTSEKTDLRIIDKRLLQLYTQLKPLWSGINYNNPKLITSRPSSRSTSNPVSMAQSTVTTPETHSESVTPSTATSLSRESLETINNLLGWSRKVFLDIAVCDVFLGRVILDLDIDVTPITSSNFLALCVSRYGISYKGASISLIVPGFYCQGGGLIDQSHTSNETPGIQNFKHESFLLKHTEAGIIGMCNSGEGSSHSSEFYITFRKAPELDNKFVVFGLVSEGLNILENLQSYGSENGTTSERITILNCGQL